MNEIENPIIEHKEYNYSNSSDSPNIDYQDKSKEDIWLYGSHSIWNNNPVMKFDATNGYYIYQK